MEHKVQGSTKHAKTRQAKVVQETGHMCTYVCGARELVTKRQALSLQIHCQDIKTSRNNSIIIIRAHMRTLEPVHPSATLSSDILRTQVHSDVLNTRGAFFIPLHHLMY